MTRVLPPSLQTLQGPPLSSDGLQTADQGLPGPEGSPSPDSSHPLWVFKLTADNASITLPLPLCMPIHSEDSSPAKSVLVGPSLRARFLTLGVAPS